MPVWLVLLLLGLGLLVQALQVHWESSGAPEPRFLVSATFHLHALQVRDWLEGGGGGRWPFPDTHIYPPLAFLLAGAAHSIFGPGPAVARLSQGVFVLGFVLLMGRVGWQLAGSRGAALMGVVAAGCPWVVQYERNLTMVPGLLFSLALMMAALLDSRGLTRLRPSAWVGFSLAIGMLVKPSFLLYSIPLLAASALPGLLRDRRSLLLGLLAATTWPALQFLVNLGTLRRASLPRGVDWALVGWTEALFLALLAAAVLASRRGRATTGAGLALAVAVAGLICSPWYMMHLDFLTDKSMEQIGYAPLHGAYGGLFHSLWKNALFLHSLYWGGLAFLGLGLAALLAWRRTRPATLVLGAGLLGSFLLESALLPPFLRYLAPLAPLALVPSFLGLARWRWSFAIALPALVVLGVLQVGEYAVPPAMGGLARHCYDLPEGSPQSPGAGIPRAHRPNEAASLLRAVPAGARVGWLEVDPPLEPPEVRTLLKMYVAFLSEDRSLRRLEGLSPGDLEGLDYVLVAADSEEGLASLEARPKRPRRSTGCVEGRSETPQVVASGQGRHENREFSASPLEKGPRLQEPQVFRVRFEVPWIYLGLYRIRPAWRHGQ